MAIDSRGGYSMLTGNQVGALLCDFLLTTGLEAGTLPSNAAVVKTIVTTELARVICERHGVTLMETLAG